MARLQSLRVKEREENENMKTAMHDLQDQLAKKKILIQEELKRTNEGEIAGKQMLASVTASLQLELRESRELFTLDQTKKAENQQLLETEKLALREKIAVITKDFESLTEQTKAKNEQLGHDHQKREVLLNEQSEYNAKEMARLQSLRVKEGQENENMKTAMHDLQDQLAKNKILIQEELKRTNEGEIAGKQMLASVTASLQLELRESRELFTLDQTKKAENQQLLETEKLALRERIAVITKDFESLTEQTKAKNEQLGHDHQKREVLLNEQSENNAKEMARLQSLRVKEGQENENMKTAMHDLQDQLAKKKILIQEELKRTNEGEIAGKQMLASVTSSLQLELRESRECYDANIRKSEEENLGKLESLRNEQQTVTDALRLEVLGLQDNIDSLNAKSEYNAKEMARLQSLAVKERGENENMKTAMHELQGQLAKNKILIQKELQITNEGQIAGRQMSQLELRESRELFTLDETEKAENQQLLETEKMAQRERIAVITKDFESLTEQTKAKNEQLGHDHQKREVLLNEQSENNAKEMARLQSLRVKEGQENENMKTAMHDLQDQLAKKTILIQEELKRTNEGEIAGKQMLASVTSSLQLELRESRECYDANIRKSEEENLGKLESLRNEQQTVTDALRFTVLGLQDNIGVLREEKNRNADELARIQSLTVKQYEENNNLKTEKKDYEDQLKDAQELILVNQELFTLDETEKAENQQLLETEKLALRERIAVITKEFQSVTEQTQAKNEQLGHDHQKREVLLNEQNENLKTALQDVQQQLVEAYQQNAELSILTSEDQSDTSSIETTPEDQSIESLPESSLDEDETRSVWRYGSKGLLSFTLQVGISALVAVTGGIIAASVDAFNSDCNGSQSSYVCSLLTSFCFNQAVPPPF
ncbi:hypothetical protein JOQ06_016194 [Pogonophryne albipinna]|uniref:Uncharacterized protein n=1 Tax=Pogonophryne albipinna TaxID=1090488 RepID=A0AAD6API6_9TELE|nr:hypothetical protein JOQ06_016194 [Pogonophryne albipinna]